MSARQSARLKGAATKAMAAVVPSAARGAKRSVSTTTTTKKTETVAVVITTTTEQSETNDNPPPPAKKAKAASTDNKASTAKDAWGALFAKKSLASKSSSDVQLQPSQAISSELQAKIDGYAAFDGLLTTRSEAAVTLKIAAWNVNGLRALLKKEQTVHMRAYVAKEDPDVLCLSETKIDKDELQKVYLFIYLVTSFRDHSFFYLLMLVDNFFNRKSD